jgi:Fur family transcriptional regulator, peroxide stress response regulator
MERITNQKQLILNYLQSVKTHPTTEEVFIAVKKKLPKISLATVYRNLELFSKKGLAQKIQGETKRFDGDISDHQHFVCDDCGKVFDIFKRLLSLRSINKEAERFGKIKNSQVYLYGTCKECQDNN